MRIVLLIDRLTSGGAQRQLLLLAEGLRCRGEDVTVLTYYPGGLFAAQRGDGRLKTVALAPRTRLGKFRQVRAWLRENAPDIVHAFLPTASAVAELSGTGGRSWKLVVSERNNYPAAGLARARFLLLRNLHRAADWVTTNSESNRRELLRAAPWLARKTSTIWNAVDIQAFSPPKEFTAAAEAGTFRFLCVAAMLPSKNALGAVRALQLLRRMTTRPFHLQWVGRCDREEAEQRRNLARVTDAVKKCDVGQLFTYCGEREDIHAEMMRSDALLLCSLYEGFPNVVAEAMASGLPVCASAVSDVPSVIGEGREGFLCDPGSPDSIARAMHQALSLSAGAKSAMGARNRDRAERLFGLERYVDQHQNLYRRLAGGRS